MTSQFAGKWARLEDLMRELGAVRVEADEIEHSAGATTVEAVHERIEEMIRAAASAVDQTIDAAESRESLLSAWEAIILARDAIENLRKASAQSLAMMQGSAVLRQRAERLMREAEERARLSRALFVRKPAHEEPEGR